MCFAGLWNFADKAGRLEDRPKRLKVEIFPYDDINIELSLDLLSQYKNGSSKPFIQRYEIESEKYIQIVNWDKHQKPHHTEAESKIPPAPHISNLYNIKKEKGMEKGTIKGMGSVEQATTKLSNGGITVNNIIKEVIEDLNIVLSTSYRHNTKSTQVLIKARLNENYTVEDFKTVHRKMLRAWGTSEKMIKFLRPITLYSNKFESYFNQKEVTTKLTESGVKAYLIGQSWLKKESENVRQE